MALLSSRAFGRRRFAMERRTCTIVAHTICDVLVLSKAALEAVAAEFPILLQQMLDEANKRLNALGEMQRITKFSDAAALLSSTAAKCAQWKRRASKVDDAQPSTQPSAPPPHAFGDEAPTTIVSSFAGAARVAPFAAAAAPAAGEGSGDDVEVLPPSDGAELATGGGDELSSLAADVTEMRRELAEAATERQLILGALQALEGKLSEMVPRVEPDEG